MVFTRFDPFEDRLARDIRNDLSRVFMKSLATGDMEPVRNAARNYLDQHVAPLYRDYILARLDLYEASLRAIKRRTAKEVVMQALVLWDKKLFFEVHELLEDTWHRAVDPERKVLQALIRAAGVYVHLERGNRKGAEKMAARAIEALTQYRDAVPPYVKLDVLLNSLLRLDPTPPLLLADKGKNSLVMPGTTE